MHCSAFARMLADFQEGKLSPGERTDAEAHLQSCEGCRRLLAIARGNISILPDERGRNLADSILECTSGPTCPRVESLLCDFIDGKLEDDRSQLIALHLDHCASCRTVADSLLDMQEVLPVMAEIEPGECFTREVVQATSFWRPFRPGMRTRLLMWWNKLVNRPRFSFEAAYVGTLVLVFAFGSPVLPFRNTALERLGSAAIPQFAREGVAKILPSNLVAADEPILRYARGIAEAAAQREQSVSGHLNRLMVNSEQIVEAAFDRKLAVVKSWNRKVSEDLRTLRSSLSNRIMRFKA